MRVAVVGGGITGLAAAWEAAIDGQQVIVFDEKQFGGKIKTIRNNDFLIESGPDSFVSYRPAMLKLIDEIGASDQVIPTLGTRKVTIRAHGRMHPIPKGMNGVLPTKLVPFITTGILSPTDKLRASLDLVLPRILNADDMSIGAFLRKRLGNGIASKFADPFIGGIYGASVDELSIDAVLPSLRVNEREYRSLMLAALAAGKTAKKHPPRSGSVFRTLKSGLEDLIDRLVTELRNRGVTLADHTPVVAVSESFVRLADGTQHEVDGVILAGGVASSATLLRPDYPEVAAILDSIPTASTNVVTLSYDSSAFAGKTVSHGWLEADQAPVSGVTISSAKFPGRAPDDVVLARAFVPDRVGKIAKASEHELTRAVIDHIAKVTHTSHQPNHVWVSRWSKVMPKYLVGHLDRVAGVEDGLAKTRLRVAGSALNGVGLPDCVKDGRKKMRELIG
uniref:protoporphyrinogen oxidase n=1 Tax=Vaginimicrobium propionicum TaxID=1871034 RepID=UPI0018D3F9D7|nr:protoporphyrinogen oxidase [Vaginimicrobium propionicum]